MKVHRTIATLELAGLSATAGAPAAGWRVAESGVRGLLYDIGGGEGGVGTNDFSGRGGGLAFSKISAPESGAGNTPALQVFRLFCRLRRNVLRTAKTATAIAAIRITATIPPMAPPDSPLFVLTAPEVESKAEGVGVPGDTVAKMDLVAWAAEAAGSTSGRELVGAGVVFAKLLELEEDTEVLELDEVEEEVEALELELLELVGLVGGCAGGVG